MASLLACAEAGFEPIPGYVLRERLGAGGYGEVWLADAPGGLKKAIKFVFGSLDDDRASRELKALNRIRQVTHPFLLSLERIEVIEGQLLIVTELADGCLHDRYKQFCEQGSIGIPRDQLLDYLRDAADALDFLCQKHDLQHLDVKPANMLLVADRVKVADFGLVKDVQSNSMSMMGGMTPIYAAPEMFDGRPGRFSDQYSLAIVYQELLTGSLPFGGRTTAQLASEHLHRAPNLDPVPPADRPILSKALAKKPNQRFSSCREFVEQLLAVGRAPVAVAPAAPAPANHFIEPVQRPRPAQPSEAKSVSTSSAYVPNLGNTNPSIRRETVTLPAIEIGESTKSFYAPSMFLGLGGTGAEMLTSLRSELHRHGIDVQAHDEHAYLLVDTEQAPLDAATSPETCGFMDYNSVLHLPLKSPQYYRSLDEFQFSPISRRWLYNVPRSKTTEGIRPLAMLALLDHAELCYKVICNYVSHLANQSRLQDPSASPHVRVYLLASAHGATGSGMLNEFAFLIRRAMDEQGVSGVIQAFLTVSGQDDRYGHNLQGASAMVCLEEISHYIHTAGLHPGLPSLPPSHAAPRAPFDQVYLVQGGVVGDNAAWEASIDQIVEFVFADACSPLGVALDKARQETMSLANTQEIDWTPWLRTLCSRRLNIDSQLSPKYVAQLGTLEAAQRWMRALKLNELDLSAAGSTKPPHSKKTLEHLDFLVSDLFRNHRWTAQAFVARCVVMLNQEQHVPLEASEVLEDFVALMDPKMELEVDLISGRLGLELDRSRYDANCLLDSTLLELQEWLQVNRGDSIDDLGYWNTLLQMIARRFVEQGTGLRNVSQRLRTEHDTILDKLHSKHNERSSDQSIAVELDRLEIQARLHEIAGLMLIRLGQYVDHQSQLWKSQAALLFQELHQLCLPLAQDLDLRLHAQGFLTDAPLPMPQDWNGVAELVQAQGERVIEAWIGRAYDALWSGQRGASPSPSMAQGDTSHAMPTTGEAALSLLKQALSKQSLSKQSLLQQQFQQQRPEPSSAASPAVNSVPQPVADVTDGGSTTCEPVVVTEAEPTFETLFASALDLSMVKCYELGLKWVERTSHEEQPASSSIANQMRESTPSLLQWGGAKRNILLLPTAMGSDESQAKWKAMFEEPVSIALIPDLSSPILLCDGEQLNLNEIQENLWIPTREKSTLAQRLHSRVDVDWIPLITR